MLIPGGLAYLAGGLALLAVWLAAAESRTPAGTGPYAADRHR
jgi:hypothetical protein